MSTRSAIPRSATPTQTTCGVCCGGGGGGVFDFRFCDGDGFAFFRLPVGRCDFTTSALGRGVRSDGATGLRTAFFGAFSSASSSNVNGPGIEVGGDTASGPLVAVEGGSRLCELVSRTVISTGAAPSG